MQTFTFFILTYSAMMKMFIKMWSLSGKHWQIYQVRGSHTPSPDTCTYINVTCYFIWILSLHVHAPVQRIFCLIACLNSKQLFKTKHSTYSPTHVFKRVAFLLLTAFLSGSLRLTWMNSCTSVCMECRMASENTGSRRDINPYRPLIMAMT